LDFQDLKGTEFGVPRVTPSPPTPHAPEESTRLDNFAGKDRQLIVENGQPDGSQNLEIEVELVDSESGFLEEQSETDESKQMGQHGVDGLTDEVLARLAAKLADEMTRRFVNNFLEEITDAIVERVIARLAEKGRFSKSDQ
jgi:hypothetical protein